MVGCQITYFSGGTFVSKHSEVHCPFRDHSDAVHGHFGAFVSDLLT